MDKFVIKGGKPLKGEVRISGAKNAAVAILPAVMLADSPCIVSNLPDISDVREMIEVINHLGGKVRDIDNDTVEIDPTGINKYTVDADMAGNMRASSYFLGALLGRMGLAEVASPGGCDFGIRPIDQHIKGFEILGANVSIEDDMVVCKSEKLSGGYIYLDVVSVGATINIMLAAVKAEGLTVIENAAKEPHIVDMANFLNMMGANIMGAGTSVIKIRGVNHLNGVSYSIIPDQIEAGTYMAAAVGTKGNVLINNVIPQHLDSIIAKLVEIGATVEEFDEAVRISVNGELKPCRVKTMPHPGFPTDMQPQITTVLSVAKGESKIHESVWDNRFKYVSELLKFGADVEVEAKYATVRGVEKLTGADVVATDLRAGAAMIIAGIMADGETTVSEIEHIDRGYENIVGKFTALGADIRRVSE